MCVCNNWPATVENGPYHINEDLSLERSEYGWDVNSNMIFVDQPINTGFSYSDVCFIVHSFCIKMVHTLLPCMSLTAAYSAGPTGPCV